VLSPNPAWGRIVLFLPALTIGMVVIGALGYVPLWVGGLLFGLQALVVRQTSKLAKRHFLETDRMAGALESYAELITHIQGHTLGSALGQQLQGQIKTEGRPAQDEIRAVVALLKRFELRMNGLVYFFMNFLFFWDIQTILGLEAWKARNKGRVVTWFTAVGEVEALCGLAAVHDGRTDWIFPEVVEGPLVLEGEALGHPLIPDGQRVSNPVHLPHPGLAWLVTGSNMSGKSTYLRTVGVNVLLALVGAPVCATRLRLSPVMIAASMRTADSLEENTSSFYAELKRLKNVIQSVQGGQPTLFLLDEILKGTNSKDRHAGARALIRQLVQGGGAGLVSTHDLELQDLADSLPGGILNYSFHCDVRDDGTLHFDYRLRDGVCQSMNATALMRAMGIAL
jgi:MutS domain V